MRHLVTLLLCVSPLVAANELEMLDEEAVVSEASMQELRGGEYLIDIDHSLANAELDADSIGNVAIGVSSGDNNITSGAFGSSSGVTSVIQNTGHNVLIQNATVINLSLE